MRKCQKKSLDSSLSLCRGCRGLQGLGVWASGSRPGLWGSGCRETVSKTQGLQFAACGIVQVWFHIGSRLCIIFLK